MKKRLAALLAVLMMLTVCLPALGECTPLLYRATDGAGHEIYLMGTIHLARESTYPLPDYVLDAFERCDVLARIPIFGAASSLNVGCATSICLYEIARQRANGKK